MSGLSERLEGRKRALFVGSYGVGNLGDEAILSVLLDEAPRGTRKVIVSRSPAESRALHGAKAVQSVSPLALLEVVRADAVVLGGGGIFSGLSGRLTKALPAFLRAAERAGKPLHVEGLGIYPDTPRSTLERMMGVLKDAASVTVRDRTSHELLLRAGVPCERVADPATRLEPASLEEAREALEVEGIPVDRDYVGVSPRRVRNPAEQQRLERELVLTLRRLQRTGRSVLFLPTAHFRFGTYTNDLHYSEDLARRLDPELTAVARAFHHPRLACALFRVPRVHLTMRLHAMIFAWRVGRASVPIAYADKVADVAKELEIDAVPVAEVDAPRLVDRLDRALTGPG